MNDAKEIFIFIGPPGSGKGSLSQLCVEKLGWIQLSTGNLCRMHIAERTQIGTEIDLAIKSGKLISDDLVVNMVDSWFQYQSENVNTVILDGFPRTVKQACLFDTVAREKLSSFKLRVVRFFSSDVHVIIERLSARLVCTNKQCQRVYSALIGSSRQPKVQNQCDFCHFDLIRRKDDDQEVVVSRLDTYYRHEKELLDFYRGNNHASVLECNIEQPLDDIFRYFATAVGINH